MVKKLKNVLLKPFEHKCDRYKYLISSSYFKDGETGLIFSTGKEYKCLKCQKKWID